MIQGPHFLSGVLQGKNIVQIDCGHTHTIALSQEGEVYSWRANRYGQLGTGSTTWEEKPVKISGLSGFERQIISVACGGWTSYALDSEGNVKRHLPVVFIYSVVNINDHYICRFGLGVIMKMVPSGMHHRLYNYFRKKSPSKTFRKYCKNHPFVLLTMNYF